MLNVFSILRHTTQLFLFAILSFIFYPFLFFLPFLYYKRGLSIVIINLKVKFIFYSKHIPCYAMIVKVLCKWKQGNRIKKKQGIVFVFANKTTP